MPRPSEMIVVRPEKGRRETPEAVRISAAAGLEGDHWSRGCWKSLPDGSPHPDVQVCLMPTRVITAVAGGRETWAAAGDNLFFDIDMTPENLPPGTRLALGEGRARTHCGTAQGLCRLRRTLRP